MDKYGGSNGTMFSHQPYNDVDSYITIHFLIGDRKEVASFRSNQVTDIEIKDLFRSAAEAGPLDIVKLRKAHKILSISAHLPQNSPDDPYILQVIGVHPDSSDMVETNLLRVIEKRIVAVERELRNHQETLSTAPCITLHELKKEVDLFRKKLETTEHLSWLGFHKQLPEPITSTACRRLQYRRKSNNVKRRVRENFLQINDVALVPHAREWIRSPTFDARQWEDEELLLMLQTMFIELELPQKFNIALSTLHNFIFEVYNNYNEVPFHNFRHCFCVAQMMYAIVWAVDLIRKIGELEVLILLVSCICHDLDHPGYNNIYQINARTELALRYNDISPLENHHCSVAFRVLEAPECNILAALDCDTYRTVREGIIRCILATDMARHNEILAQFTDAVADFDFTNKAHINLLSMVLIKVADISNEARPMDVAEPWLDNLLQEFFKQSDAEKLEGLPVTPFMDRDKITKPSSQCSFIGLVLLPLFEVLGELFPELQELIIEPVRYALDYYRRLNDAAKDERHQRKSLIELGENTTILNSMLPTNEAARTGSREQLATLMSRSSMHSLNNFAQQQQCYHHEQQQQQSSAMVVKSTSTQSIRSGRSINTLHSRSRSIEDEARHEGCSIPLSSTEVADLSSSDPETATEVEVSEKTLKFKIATEGAVGHGRKSYPGSRKGSREKSSLDYHNYELVKAVHEHECRRSRTENPYSDHNSPKSARSTEETRISEELEGDDQRLVELQCAENKQFETHRNVYLKQQTTYQCQNKRLNKRTFSCDSKASVTHCDHFSALTHSTVNKVVSGVQRPSSNSQKYFDMISHEQLSRCCCDNKHSSNHHKSLFSRLRNFTDRLSISFDSKDTPGSKSAKCPKSLNKSLSTSATSSSLQQQHNNAAARCKKCNLSKFDEQLEKPSLTLSKIKQVQNGKQKSWRTVFSKERGTSTSLEILPAESSFSSMNSLIKHRRNLSNPEGESTIERNAASIDPVACITFEEIDYRCNRPEILVDRLSAGTSTVIEDIGIVEIRRSSASMEDISKIIKQNDLDVSLLGCTLDQQTGQSEECHQYSGSLDSILCKEIFVSGRQSQPSKPVIARQPMTNSSQPKKSLPGLFLRFKSGMNVDGTRSSSNSGSLHEQQQQGWISSLTASFRPKRQACDQQGLPLQPPSSPNREEVK